MTRAEAEAALAGWKRRSEQVGSERDQLIRAAHAAGLNIRRIHLKSGIGRATIYRILGPDAGADAGADTGRQA
jgi:hypothetical protein